MQKIWNIAWNDIRIEFSYRATLVFFLILPVVFTLIIGAGLSGGNSSSPDGDARIPFLVVDLDNSSLSARLMQTFENSQVVRPVNLSLDEAEARFEDQQAAVLLTIPFGLETNLLDNRPVELDLRKQPNSSQVFPIEEAVRAAAARSAHAIAAAHASLQAAEEHRPFANQAEGEAYFQASLEMADQLIAEIPVTAITTRADTVNPQTPRGFEQASPGQLVTWSLITMLAASEVFVNERLGGTLRRLLITPTRKIQIILGKISGRLLLGMLQMLILIVFGAVFLGVNWGRSPLALAGIVLSFGLAAVSFGVLLGSFIRTRSQASWLTIMFSMLLAALGGAWWPLEITPPYYQTAVSVLPTTWAMRGFSNVIVRGQGLEGVLLEIGVLLLFALAFFSIGVWRLRFE